MSSTEPPSTDGPAADAADLDAIMEAASGALAEMDYLECEARCLEALVLARQRGDWAYYARVLLPLQESRRQRRMIAADGTIWLGTTGEAADPLRWLERVATGCVVVSHPHTAEDAAALTTAARDQRQYVEVMFADNPGSEKRWALASFAGPPVRCEVPAPPALWVDRWLVPPSQGAEAGAEAETWLDEEGRCPADWFLDAAEALGDAALAQVNPAWEPARQLEAIEACLEVVTDHEIIHQRLGEVARALCLGEP